VRKAFYICKRNQSVIIKNKAMKTLEIKTANIYNNGFNSKINVNLSNGKTMCKNLQMSDLKKYTRKEVTGMELANKYFQNIT